jgi:hypothetical protein
MHAAEQAILPIAAAPGADGHGAFGPESSLRTAICTLDQYFCDLENL